MRIVTRAALFQGLGDDQLDLLIGDRPQRSRPRLIRQPSSRDTMNRDRHFHAPTCRLHLDHIAHLGAMIARLDAQVEAMMAPFHAERDPLTTVPGIDLLAAVTLISEIGAASPSSSPAPGTGPPRRSCARQP